MAIARDRRHVDGFVTDRLTTVSVTRAAAAGLTAGIVMAMFAMLANVFTGDGFWAPPRAITATFFGAEHAGTAFAAGSVVVGMMIHMTLSAMFGGVFAAGAAIALPRITAPTYLVAGMLWGMLLWAINTFAIAQVLPGQDALTDAMPSLTWIVAHLMFGAALGLLYAAWQTRHDDARVA